jgi:hypothetical protein
LAAAALLAVSLASCSSKVGYAALVNGTPISQDKINQELADLSANSKYVQFIATQGTPVVGSAPGSYSNGFVAALLDQQVRFEIIHQRVVAAHALPAPDKVAAAKAAVSSAFPAGMFAAFPSRYQDVLATQQAETDAFVADVTRDLSPEAINAYYQAHQGTYTSEVCVRHILFASRDPSGQLDYAASLAGATMVKGLLDAGGDFVGLAKQYSQDNQGTNASADQGGVISGSATDGCLSSQNLQQLGPDFTNAVVNLPLNQLSSPVRTQFGYHLFEVTSRVTAPVSDDSVTSDIRQRMASQHLTQLVAKAKVNVNPEFGSFDKNRGPTGQILGVTPPLVPDLTPGRAGTSSPTSPTSTPASTAGS